jgi:hypothetical protein
MRGFGKDEWEGHFDTHSVICLYHLHIIVANTSVFTELCMLVLGLSVLTHHRLCFREKDPVWHRRKNSPSAPRLVKLYSYSNSGPETVHRVLRIVLGREVDWWS